MLNKLLLYILVFVLAILCPPLIGAYHYGVLGFFAGVGLAFILLKLFSRVIRWRFTSRMKDIEQRMQAEAQLLEGAAIELLQLTPAEAGALWEDDSADLRAYYPTSYQLELRVSPQHDRPWKTNCLNLEAHFDESAFEENDERHEKGFGLYLYSTKLKDQHGEFSDLEERTGAAIVRFHFGAGSQVKRIKLQAHEKALQDFDL
jgi:hypothetical protein